MTLTVSADEALVLFDWLARTSEAAQPVAFRDHAERVVLWNLEALLERVLVAPLRPDYTEQLRQARGRVRGGVDPSR